MSTDSLYNEFKDGSTTILEWTLKDLRSLFDSSCGETKSQVTKSILFGGGRWRILFYPNSGSKSGAHISLFLSCEMDGTSDVFDIGEWRLIGEITQREGLYHFTFEIRTINKTLLLSKEAQNHSFSHKTTSWGWAQFARRDSVYYEENAVKTDDAFLIIGMVTSTGKLDV